MVARHNRRLKPTATDRDIETFIERKFRYRDVPDDIRFVATLFHDMAQEMYDHIDEHRYDFVVGMLDLLRARGRFIRARLNDVSSDA